MATGASYSYQKTMLFLQITIVTNYLFSLCPLILSGFCVQDTQLLNCGLLELALKLDPDLNPDLFTLNRIGQKLDKQYSNTF
jgi:hypothetical protein